MASKSVLELAVGTGQWDAGLKKAKSALDNFTQANGGLQQALNKDSASMQKFVQMMGTMDSQAKTAKGQMNDYKGVIEQLTMQYNRMTDAQKKTIGQDYLHAIDQMKQKYQGVAEEVQKINQSLKSMPEPAAQSGGGLFGGGKMSGMLQVFGGNVMTKLAGAGMGFVTEMGDMVKQGIELARAGEGIRIAFERLGRGDILDGLRKATHGTVTDLELMKAAVKFNDFKLPLDELGTMLAFAQQKAKDTGQSVDYMVDSIVTGLGRKSLMILDNLGLSATEIRERMKETGDMTKAVGAIIRDEMAKAGDYVETAADRAAQANVSLQNKMEELGRKFAPVEEASNQLWTSIKIGILDIVGGPLARLLNGLTEAGRLKNMLDDMNGGGNGKETQTEKALRLLRQYSGGGRGIEGKRDLYNRQVAKYNRQEEKAWREANRLREELKGLRRQQKENGLAGNLQPLISDTSRKLEAAENRAKAIQIIRANYKKGAEAILNPATDKPAPVVVTNTTGGGTTTTTHTQTPQQRAQESFTKAEQNYKQALEQAAMELEAGTITRAEAKKKEMQAAEQRWKAISDARNIADSPELKQAQSEAAANYKTLAAEVKQMDDAIKAAKIKWEKGESGFNAETMNAWMKGRQGDLQHANYGTEAYNNIAANIADMTTIKTIIEQRLKAGMDAADTDGIMEQLWERVFDGENIPDEVWQSITDKINENLKKLGLDTIKIDFTTGETSEKGRGREKANKTKDPMMELSKAINGLTSIRGGLEGMGIKLPAELEKGLNVLQGLMSIIQGVQAVISIFSTSTETANTIAVAANTVALGTLTAAVTANTATNFLPFAKGGVVHAANGYVDGNTYSGDQIPSMLNAGEVVLNRSQQGVLAASLQAVGQSGEGGGDGKPYVSGEMIWLGLTNYLNRSGRGEIVTSKRR